MASRPRPSRASRTASCSTTAKEWLAAPAAHPRFPELKPNTTTTESTTPASKSCVDHETASTPPAPAEERSEQPVDGPTPFRNGTTERSGLSLYGVSGSQYVREPDRG